MATDSVPQVAPDAAGSGRRVPDDLQSYYQTLLSRLPWPGGRGPSDRLRTLGLTSCYSGEGVSTVAGQLAATAAADGEHRVLLVDANLERPSVHRAFRARLQPGLPEVLADPGRLSEAIQSTGTSGLWVVSAGRPHGGSERAWDAPALAEVVTRLAADFDLTVFDLPPSGQMGAATRLAALLDGLVLVVEAERVRWEVAQRTSELLKRANARLLGAVLNKRRQHVPNWLYRTL